jgi:hypothetical protein
MPRKQERPLKIKGALNEVLQVAFAPVKKSAKALPKKKSRPKKGEK